MYISVLDVVNHVWFYFYLCLIILGRLIKICLLTIFFTDGFLTYWLQLLTSASHYVWRFRAQLSLIMKVKTSSNWMVVGLNQS